MNAEEITQLNDIKHKLMAKPDLQDRKRVVVKLRVEEPAVVKTVEEARGKKRGKVAAAKIVETAAAVAADVALKTAIIDKSKDIQYDRASILKRLAENNKIQVIVKPNVSPVVAGVEDEAAEKPKKEIVVKKPVVKRPIKINEVLDAAAVVADAAVAEADAAPTVQKRRTKKVVKGVAELGAEVPVYIGDTNLADRLPERKPQGMRVSSYFMNNREIFVNFINSLFEPYKKELENEDAISCDTLGKTKGNLTLLPNQKIVRDYMNAYTPYRGLLVDHGLGSGKSCTSIAFTEGMKDSKQVIVMTPASLRANYMEELKKCGDVLYKKNQYWEWIPADLQAMKSDTSGKTSVMATISGLLNLPMEFIRRHKGAFFMNVKKTANFDDLTPEQKILLDNQINAMIEQKYKFINYNGLQERKLSEMTQGYKINIFDNSAIVIDEAHNFISRIVNKLKREPKIKLNKRGEKAHLPLNMSVKLYEMLMSAKNARIVLLSGTPVINYPNEFGILFNILRGYIKTWYIPLQINTTSKVDRGSLLQLLQREKSMDYLDYSPTNKELVITRNPFGFKNKIKKDSGYKGVSNAADDGAATGAAGEEEITDEEFEQRIVRILKQNDIDVKTADIKVKYLKCLPDDFEQFMTSYVNLDKKELKNTDGLKRRILGLSSYFKSASETLLPKYDGTIGADYNIIKIPMSDLQFKLYEAARTEERKSEKPMKGPAAGDGDVFDEKPSTYRIFSRLICNFAIPDRPYPMRKFAAATASEDDAPPDDVAVVVDAPAPAATKTKRKRAPAGGATRKKKVGFAPVAEEPAKILSDLPTEVAVPPAPTGATAEKVEDKLTEAAVGEIEGDELLDAMGGVSYKERLAEKIKYMESHQEEFFSPKALEIYSPKFLHILENIESPDYAGLHLVYSQFRTAEGIGLLAATLDANGFTQFKIRKTTAGEWKIDIPEEHRGKPTYALYTGTESVEEKEMIRHIYNGEWDDIPESLSAELHARHTNNNMGEVIKVFMITSSGSEGINLRNTRYVHLTDPYWHPVRSEQVIGRARRICSHRGLPEQYRTVEVFVYLMTLSEEQLKSDEAIELKRQDVSKSIPRVPQTSDEYLYEISKIKETITKQLTEVIQETSIDCYIHSKTGKCVNFGNPTADKFSYVPNYADQQNDATMMANKTKITWVGKKITMNGTEYVYRKMSDTLMNIYDLKSYMAALKDPEIVPLQIGTLEIGPDGKRTFRQLVTK